MLVTQQEFERKLLSYEKYLQLEVDLFKRERVGREKYMELYLILQEDEKLYKMYNDKFLKITHKYFPKVI